MTAVRRVVVVALPSLVLLVAGGCGGSDRFDLKTPSPPKATPSAKPSGPSAAARAGDARKRRRLNRLEPVSRREERVIRRWAAALRRGHPGRAARYFALPAVVSNGFSPVKVTSRKDLEAFNETLTCGAEVIRLERQVHHYVLTTFRLVNRPGPGHQPCNVGVHAQTAFLIRHGHIKQWVRVPDDPQSTAPPDAS